MTPATAQANPNLAFIKYWGNCEDVLRLPMNGSISMNLEGLTTRTSVSFQHSLAFDELIINGHEVTGAALAGGGEHLERERRTSCSQPRRVTPPAEANCYLILTIVDSAIGRPASAPAIRRTAARVK